MRKLLVFPVLVFFILVTSQSKASHVLGAEAKWKCIGQDSFLVTLLTYHDCNTYGFGNIKLSANCKTTGKQLFSGTQLQKTKGIDVTPVCGTTCTRCDSPGCAYKYGIKKTEYRYILDLSKTTQSCCEVEIYWSSCCRSKSITTGPGGLFYYEAALNRCVSPGTASPDFMGLPEQIICKGADQYFELGEGLEQDSTKGYDSLSYELTQPLKGKNDTVSWIGKYDYNKPVFFWGFPKDKLPSPKGFNFNTTNGDLYFRPMKEEETEMAILVKFFNRGVQIGEVRREFVIYIVACPDNDPPELSQIGLNDVCVGDTIKMKISSYDGDTVHQDTVRLSFNKGNLPEEAKWEDTNGDSIHPSGTLTWTPDASNSGSVYTFFVTSNDNFCPNEGVKLRSYRIKVKPKPKVDITTIDTGCGKVYFEATPQSPGAFFYHWKGANGLNTTQRTFIHQSNKPEKYPFSLTVTAQGCEETYYDTARLSKSMYVDIGDEIEVCPGDSLTLGAKAKNTNGPVSYLWHNGVMDSIQTFNNLTQNQTVFLRVKDRDCEFTDTAHIYVRSKPVSNLGMPRKLCKDDTFDINPQIVTNLADTGYYPWVYLYGGKTGTLKWFKQGNPFLIGYNKIKISDSGTYILKVSDRVGCTQMDTLHVSLVFRKELDEALPDTLLFCKGSVIELRPQSGIRGYKWSTGDTTKTLIVKDLQKDSIVSVAYAGCDFKDSVLIDFFQNNTNSKVHLQNDTLICYKDVLAINPLKLRKDTSANISYYINDGADSLSIFNWYPRSKVSQQGLKGLIHGDGPVIFELIDELGCRHSDTIHVSHLKEINNILPPDTTICPGDWIKLTTTTKYDFEWNNDSTLTSKSIWVTGGKTYNLKIFCGSCVFSDSIKIGRVNLPSRVWVKDVLVFDTSGVLTAPSGFSYLWSTGDITQSIRVWRSGNYSVKVSAKDCEMQDTVHVNILHEIGVKEGTVPTVSLYPNPVEGFLVIEFLRGTANYSYTITSIDGKFISSGKIKNQKTEINTDDLNEGIYLIQIMNEQSVVTKYFMVR